MNRAKKQTTGKKSTKAAAGRTKSAAEAYPASSINEPEPDEEKRNRRTQEEMEECRTAIRKAAAAEHPLTLRRLFYILVRDNDLTWTGRCWADVELWGDSPLTFASRDEAAAYAQTIWGE